MRATFNQIIRVGKKAHQSVSFSDESQLLLPKLNRIVIQDVKKRIILCSRERKFDDFSYEIRHNRTTTAAHWFQVRDVRNGHIVGKLEEIIPVLLSIHRPGT